MMQLRPYQLEAKNAVLREWEKGHRKTLIVLPTGTGKTIVFSSVAAEKVQQGGRTLILAHRGELLEQAADKLKSACGIDSALEKAEYSSLESNLPVTVGSVQSLCREERLSKFPKNHFSEIIIDEAHHALSDSYQKVLNHFTEANVLGVTATPDRGDMRNLGKYFDSLAYEYPLLQAINDGFLCKVKAQMIPIKLDITDVSLSNGDYSSGDLGGALDGYLEEIAESMLQYCRDRKTVVFLPLIATSQKLCEILNDKGLSAAEVNGTSSDRAEILKDFEAGKYSVLCNSMLLTEGWDCPAVDCVVVLRPTKIRSLYQQMVGRGMRLFPGKEELLLLDFLWMTARHDLCKPSSLLCKDGLVAEEMDKILEEGEALDILVAEEKAKKSIMQKREALLAKELHKLRSRKQKCVDPLVYSISIEDEDLADYMPTFAWEYDPPTDKQLSCLERCGIDTSEVLTKGLASQLIDRISMRTALGLSTPKQIRLLESYGFEHVGQWKFKEASNIINIIANNDWQVPEDLII